MSNDGADHEAEERPPGPRRLGHGPSERLAEAVSAHGRGRLDLAEPIYRDILRQAPDHPDALHLLGLVAHQRGDQAEAIGLIERARRVDPGKGAYANSLGLVFLAQGRLTEAEASFARATTLDPALAEAHNNLGNVRMRSGDVPAAVAAYERAIGIRPAYAEAHANLGATLRRAGQLVAARQAVERALQIRPDYVGALCTLGLIRHEQGEYDAALAAYDRALALDPNHATTRANRATLLLLLGRMEEGWREYEWRWRVPGFTTQPRDFAKPAWDGSDLAGRTILIHAEQGLGSAIQFVRYVPLVAARGGRVILECQPPLARLFASLRPAPEVIVQKGEPLPDFAVHAPLMSLPRLLGTTLESIPNTVPYLAAEADLCALWRERLEHVKRPRVGLVWAGNPNHANDRNRSLPARLLAPLLACTGVAFIDLQVGSAGGEAAELPESALVSPGRIGDFADTAAIVAELDLVISVDTAVAHLAGALAKPVWLLLPFVGEWRWLRDRTDTPWYPTMRLFRQQSPGDWPGVVDAVGEACRGPAGAIVVRPAPPSARSGRSPRILAVELLTEGLDHHRHGRLAQAARAYKRILKLDSGYAHALHLLGLVRHQQGHQGEARELIQHAIAVDASNAAYHNSLGLVLLAEGDADGAAASFRAALARDPVMAEAFNNLGNAEQKAGRLAEAVASYDRALALAPDNAEALCNKGRALHGLDALAAAADAYRAALKLRPDYAKARRFLGDALAEGGATTEAEASFRKALALAPEDGETLAALAALQERAGRLEEALATAERALAADGGHVRATVAAARCERRLGRAEAGLARLRAIDAASLDADGRAHVAFELGASLDRLGAYDEAYRAYCEANAFAADTPQAKAVDRTTMPRLIARLRGCFTPDWVASWTPAVVAEEEDPVFLIGFPRSGTTLLDQILDAHPGLATMEEKPALDAVRHAVAAMPGGYPEALATLETADIRRLRRLYFSEAERYVSVPDGVRLVDKMPLNTVDVGLIARLFPKAKLLLALRHPCDVVLSGFMQAFKPNPAMVQFETLASSAAFYASVMDLWRQYESVLPLSVHCIRYEDLIGDFEGETRRMLAFLGLPWDEAVRAYAERAKTKAIATPSYHQVVQPIYARSVGRWRNYRGAFAEVLPILAPSLAAFGYETGDNGEGG